MKKSLLILSLAAGSMMAQETETYLGCGQQQAMEYLKKKYPDIEMRMKEKHAMLQKLAEANPIQENKTQAVILIPVVVHVVYNATKENISDAQVKSQIDVLNKDFNRTNTDASNTPAGFQSIAGHPNFQFCLAQKTPQGTATNGINRVQTSVTSWQPGDNSVKYTGSGGADAWDVTKYMNIWVCNIGGGVGGWGEPAYQQIPQETMGAVLQYDVFGTTGTLQSAYAKGRCTTHEVGHVFDLAHPWGDSGGCQEDDYCSDTPLQNDVTFGSCPNGAKFDACTSGGNGIMWMNYMDYTLDACKNAFTKGQSSIMIQSYTNTQTTYANNPPCQLNTAVAENEIFDNSITTFPNPAKETVNIHIAENSTGQISVDLFSPLGQLVKSTYVTHYRPSDNIQVSTEGLAAGLYYVSVKSGNGFSGKKAIVVE